MFFFNNETRIIICNTVILLYLQRNQQQLESVPFLRARVKLGEIFEPLTVAQKKRLHFSCTPTANTINR